MIRVAVVQRQVLHYRYPYFRLLSQQPGLQVTVLTNAVGQGVPAAGERDLEIRVFPSTSVDFHWGSKHYRFPLSWPLAHAVAKGGYDAVILEGSTNMVMNLAIVPWARWKGMAVFIHDAGRRRNTKVTLLRRLADPFFSCQLRLSHGVIAYGTLAAAFLRKMAGPRVPIVIAQNAIDMTEIATDLDSARCRSEAAEIRNSLPGGDGPVLLSVGALERRKKIDQLIEAYRMARRTISGLRLAIIGDGPDRGRLETLAEGDPGVTFAGAIIAGVGRWFQMADLFVLPSEGGLAINQAMAYGLPVIATSADGTEIDLVRNGETGMLADEDDVDAIAAAITTILSDPARAKAMGEAARAFIMSEVTLDRMVANVVRLLAATRFPELAGAKGAAHAV